MGSCLHLVAALPLIEPPPFCLPIEREAFTSFYSEANYPVTKVLREPVYVEVNIVGPNDPSLVLMLDRCWATAAPSPLSMPQWDLLHNG